MLTGFRVKNFKAFEDTTSIDLKPLVLLSGINSAGKSSILQALLLLKQTLHSNPGQVLNPGEPLFLGTLDKFLFGGGRKDGENPKLVYDLTFVYVRNETRKASIAPQSKRELVMYEADSLTAVYEKNETTGNILFIDRDDVELINTLETALPGVGQITVGNQLSCRLKLTFAWGTFGYLQKRAVRIDNLQVALEIDAEPLLNIVIRPGDTSDVYKLALEEHGTLPELQNMAFEQLKVDSFDHFLPESFIILQPEIPNTLRRDVSPRLAQFLRHLFNNIQSDLSEKIYYLSSFRNPPKLQYLGVPSEHKLDFYGGNFPQILWRNRDKPVYFAHPDLPYRNKERRYEMPLGEVADWVLREILELEQRIEVQPIGKREDILEVRVETLGKHSVSVTLGDVGLGYNQILPVIVQGLLTPPGGLVIFEQPEIHLHPDVQAKLVKFFVGLAHAGRRVLVETHSSHMIEHLCLEIARDESNWLAQNTQTLFIHAPDAAHESARIESIEITPYGEILNWPQSFLPDAATLDEEILRAGFAKRKKEQEVPAE